MVNRTTHGTVLAEVVGVVQMAMVCVKGMKGVKEMDDWKAD